MRTLIKVGFSLLVLGFMLIGLSFSVLRANGVNSPSNAEGRALGSETRALTGDVTEIDLTGPINMTLMYGAIPSMTVSGEQRLLGNVDTTQDGKMLHIGTKGMLLHHRKPLQVVLVLPAIDKLSIRGSGDSTIDGFSGDRVSVQLFGSGNVKFNGRYKDVTAGVSGSGDMEMNGGPSSDKVEVTLVGSGTMTVIGTCKKFKADQTGSGDLDAQYLVADATKLDLQGSGNATVQALKTADVTLHGSGDVTVQGSPAERIVNKTGSGDVTFD